MLAAVLATVTGCSTGGNSGSGNGGGTGSGTTPSGGDNQVKIEYFQMKSETVDVVNELIQQFQEENGGILVEQNNVPNPENVWTMRISTGDAPAVYTHYPHNPVFQQLSKEGRVVDLTGDPLLDNVQPAITELSQIDGKNYVVPIALATLGIYYNTEIFEELNISIPQTYDELIQAAEQLKAEGITPFVFPDKEYNPIRQEVVFKMGLLLPDIEPFLDDVMNGQAHITDREDIRDFAEQLYDFRQYGQNDLMGTGYDDAVREFANGNSAMLFTGIWAIKTIKQANPDLQFSMFPMPAYTVEDAKIQVSVDTAIGLPANGKNEEEARKFVEFMASSEAVQKYVDVGGYPAAVNGVTNNVEEISHLNDLIADGKVYPTIERVWPAGVNADVGKATQEMLITGDFDSYLQKLDDIFFNILNQ